MICLWCGHEMIPDTTWSNVFLPSNPDPICQSCQDQLYTLTAPRCRICSRETDQGICSDCVWWDRYFDSYDVIDSHYALYGYNDFLQAVIAKWKYRGDYELGTMFMSPFKTAFNNTFADLKKEALIVPVPLSSERLNERRFNQAEMLAGFLPGNPSFIVDRLKGEKQSKKTRYERIFSTNDFKINQPINKPVILVDDIYTTGTTLRHIAVQLKANGCPEIHGFTLARG